MIKWALIPVKRFEAGKSRLREVFTMHELVLLNLSLFQNVFYRLKDSQQCERILVVSRESAALEWVKANGGEALLEDGEESLNAALRQGLAWIAAQDPGSVLILPTDLPLLTENDVVMLCAHLPKDPGMLIVPDRTQTGTNTLFLTEPNLLSPQFGPGSFQAHCLQAEQLHLHQTVYLNPHIQQDIDTPEDLALIQEKFLLTTSCAN